MSQKLKRKAGDQDGQGQAKKIKGDPELTEFAKMYSHPPWFLKDPDDPLSYIDPLRSGISPLGQGPFSTEAERNEYLVLEEYQKRVFHHFTVEELQNLECYAPTSKLTGQVDLDSVPIHPAIRRSNWKSDNPGHLALFPLGNGREGYWEAKNPVVWELMLPGLRIASLLLTQNFARPWWDGLLFGELEKIDESELPRKEEKVDPEKPGENPASNSEKKCTDSEATVNSSQSGSDDVSDDSSSSDSDSQTKEVVGILHRFRRRPPEIANTDEARKGLDAVLARFSDRFEFRLHHTKINPLTGLQQERSLTDGQEVGDEFPRKSLIFLSYNILEPLLDSRTTAAERMICHFLVALYLFHELAGHGFVTLVQAKENKLRNPDFTREPYFEDECIAEAGHSLINSFLHGRFPAYIFDRPLTDVRGIPHIGLWRVPWINVLNDSISGGDEPILNGKPPDWFIESHFPVHLQYFFDFNNENFWEASIKKHGYHALCLPMSSGTKFDTRNKSWEEAKGKSQHKTPEYMGKAPKLIPIDESRMSLVQQQRAEKENSRRVYVNRILDKAENPRGVPQNEDERLEKLARYNYNENDMATKSVPFYRPHISSRRYNEIGNYLIDHYLDLALDTLYFEINEHVFMSHIMKQGNLDMDPNEWRAFLIRCNEENRYFSWAELDFPPVATWGRITKITLGWPIDLPKRKHKAVAYTQEFDSILGWWRQVTYDAMNSITGLLTYERLYEYDGGLFLRFINEYELERDYEDGTTKKYKMSAKEFHEVITYYASTGEGWCYGPKGAGVIRELIPGWNDKTEDGTPPKKTPQYEDPGSSDSAGELLESEPETNLNVDQKSSHSDAKQEDERVDTEEEESPGESSSEGTSEIQFSSESVSEF